MVRKLLIALPLLLVLSGCVGQPKTPESYKDDVDSGKIWAENTNVDEDNDSIDISDLDNNVTSSDDTGSGVMVKRIAFPAAEYSRLSRSGKGTIEGKIYLEGPAGNKVYGAKTRLYLNPVTSYSKQWYNESYLAGKEMDKADDRLFNYLRFTASDTGGKFAFYGVPTGSYYLIGTVSCGNECGYGQSKNIRVATEVAVVGNEVVAQDLSKRAE